MGFSKQELTVLFGIIMSSAEEKDLAKRFSDAQLIKLEEVYGEFIGNTTPNKLKEMTDTVIEKLLDVVLGDEQPTQEG